MICPSTSDKTQDQSGNVLFLILIAVALFAGLSYAVTGSTRTGSNSGIENEKASLNAGKILNYATAIKTAMIRISFVPCEDTHYSFENPVVLTYANTHSPPDTCKVFRPSGGSVTWQSPPVDVNDGTNWLFLSKNAVDGLGPAQPCANGTSDCTELVMALINIDKETCLKLNEQLGNENPGGDAPLENSTNDFDDVFTGTYDTQNTIGDDAAELYGKPAGCFLENAANADPPAQGDYVFYFALLER